ncbi:uncharacterized protein EDB91DRAFT_329604 [Suillus paluster]|uniref:uncharacterized protein n=1 Tax=Suillus paluster TaxID=48578 RepID=UPI001B86D963|nr:uncharacterized protein EDB91DRAFT_329604 [Suillus paluster]KAG1741446.1 hypothetical protein EDB91DRAFT_329604 [Suillus paluster]
MRPLCCLLVNKRSKMSTIFLHNSSHQNIMYSKLISVALVFADSLAPTGAVPNDKHLMARAPVSCDGFQPWQPNVAYAVGAPPVISNNQLWTAKQWSWSKVPDTSADEWTLNGPCITPIKNNVDCTPYSAWSKDKQYSENSKVTFNDHLWISVQWSSTNSPGDASGMWKDLGHC